MSGPRTRPAPPDRRLIRVRTVLVHGWFLLLDHAYVLNWLLGSLLRPVDPHRYAATAMPGRAPVLLLPGILETWDFLRPLAEPLAARGHPIHVVTALRRNWGSIPEMARRVEDYLESADLRDVVVVAHSKGGLIAKSVMTGPSGRRVVALVAINTPFGGSTHARLVPVRAVRAFLPTDAVLASLSGQVAVNERITSVASRWDPHIPRGCYLAGATNITVRTRGHFRVLRDRRLAGLVLDAVERAVPRRDGPLDRLTRGPAQ